MKPRRRAGLPGPRIIGLTGSIGMGKSTAAKILRSWRLPVHDSDATVHRLMERGGAAVAAIAAAFPASVENGVVNRRTLGAAVFGHPEALRRLERILHPLVRASERRFLKRHVRAAVVVLDIPLLFETKAEGRCDEVWVVSAPPAIQQQRVLRRPGMTTEKFQAILRQQTPDELKRRRADRVIPTGLGKAIMIRALAAGLRVGHNPLYARNRSRY
ncbi:dephospho-CoA kinase [Lacibacterium aquatile]|uniref:Dephospho-CoA kinase n=1 Tax=Lacibacterium aquatile TaxID=1168082 RepID=A0ABW5DW18_9PROT